jgi:hypothetical protein
LAVEGFDIAGIRRHHGADGLGGQFLSQEAGKTVRHFGIGLADTHVFGQLAQQV